MRRSTPSRGATFCFRLPTESRQGLATAAHGITHVRGCPMKFTAPRRSVLSEARVEPQECAAAARARYCHAGFASKLITTAKNFHQASDGRHQPTLVVEAS